MTQSQDYGRQFVAGSLIGLRAWKLDSSLNTLQSLFKQHTWTPGENHSTCLRSPRLIAGGDEHPEHADGSLAHGPQCYIRTACDDGTITKKCECGFWARTDYIVQEYGRISNPALSSFDLRVNGIVEGYGSVVAGPKGFRCTKAKVRALVLPVEMTNRQLSAEDRDWLTGEITKRLRVTYPDVVILSSLSDLFREFPLTPVEIHNDDES